MMNYDNDEFWWIMMNFDEPMNYDYQILSASSWWVSGSFTEKLAAASRGDVETSRGGELRSAQPGHEEVGGYSQFSSIY